MYIVKFNNIEFKRILKLVEESKYKYALEEFEKYLEKYPRDMEARLYYARVCHILGEFSKFKKALNGINSITNIENQIDREKYFYLMIRKKLYEGNYQECYNYIKDNIEFFYKVGERDLEIMTFLMNKLNIIDLKAIDVPTYFLKQIVEYNKERLFLHIKSIPFNSELNIQEFYSRVSQEIPNMNPYNEGFLTKSYIFKYDKCGYNKGIVVDYFKVYTLIDNDDITTMFPFDNSSRLNYVDINDLRYKDKESNVKTLSQVDKFKKRYNL